MVFSPKMDFNVFRSKRDTAINGCRPKRDKWTRPDVDCSSFSSSSSPSLWAHRGARQEACLLLTATQRHLSKQCPALLSTQKKTKETVHFIWAFGLQFAPGIQGIQNVAREWSSGNPCISLSLSLNLPQHQPASASASACLSLSLSLSLSLPQPQPASASASACLSLSLSSRAASRPALVCTRAS